MKLRKIFATFTALCIAASVAAVPALAEENSSGTTETTAWVDSVDTDWYNESSTSFEISTGAQLAGLAKLVNGGKDFSGKTITLTADINLENREWTPIGNSTTAFKGKFNGNGKTVSNLSITTGTDYLGLFGSISGVSMADTAMPTVQDLTIDGVSITPNSANYSYHGTLAGKGYVCRVVNVAVKNATVRGYRYIGGLIGHVYTRFEDCSFEGSVVGSFDQIGGIAGSGDCRAYRCSVIQGADADFVVSGYIWNGGIIGGGQEGTSCVDCYVKGNVKATSTYYGCSAAGIAGEAGMYSSCVFSGNYFDGLVYCGNAIVNTPIIGLVNTESTDVITGMTVMGNSWNTENYSADLEIAVAYMVDDTYENIAAAATRKENRDNSLVGSVADLQYLDVSAVESGEVKTVGQIESVTYDSTTRKITATTTGGKATVFYVTDSGTITSGTITPAYVTTVSVYGESTSNSTTSLVVELYAEEELIAKTSLNNIDNIIDGDLFVTWSFYFDKTHTDEYWNTEWYGNNPTADVSPTKAVLYVDGVKAAESSVEMNGPDNINPVEWRKLDGVYGAATINGVKYSTLQSAVKAAEAGDTVTLLHDRPSEYGTVTGGSYKSAVKEDGTYDRMDIFTRKLSEMTNGKATYKITSGGQAVTKEVDYGTYTVGEGDAVIGLIVANIPEGTDVTVELQ